MEVTGVSVEGKKGLGSRAWGLWLRVWVYGVSQGFGA